MPLPRSGHSAVAIEGSLVVYGGLNEQDGVTFNDLCELQTGKPDSTPDFSVGLSRTAAPGLIPYQTAKEVLF